MARRWGHAPPIDEVILRDDNLLAEELDGLGAGGAADSAMGLALLVAACAPKAADLIYLNPPPPDVPLPCPVARRLWYHLDDQRSTVLLTNETGVPKEGYEYTPYGKPIVYTLGPNGVLNWGGDGVVTTGGQGAYDNRVTYTGRSWEAPTGLHYYRTRSHGVSRGTEVRRSAGAGASCFAICIRRSFPILASILKPSVARRSSCRGPEIDGVMPPSKPHIEVFRGFRRPAGAPEVVARQRARAVHR